MILITIILIIVGITVYAIIGNLIVRYLDNRFYIDVTKDEKTDEYSMFILGMFFPIIVFYVLVKEVSTYIHYKFYE